MKEIKDIKAINSLDECNDAMTIKEVCGFLRICPEFARKLIHDNRLKAVKVGREYRVIKSSVALLVFGEEAS